MMKLLKVIANTCALTLLLFFNASQSFCGSSKGYNQHEYSKIGVVSIQSILKQSLAVLDIQKQIESAKSTLHSENIKKKIEFQNMEKNIELTKITEEKKRQKVLHLQNQMKQNILETKRKNQLILNAQSEAMKKVNEVVLSVVKEVAVNKKIGVVMPASYALYTSEEVDITTDVINILNLKIQNVPINFSSN
jgi:Skp family chaperone for outer membrane proteins